MQRFDYKVLAADGSVLSGSLRAPSDRDAARQLERRGLSPLEIRPHGVVARRGRPARLKPVDLLLAFHQLATMLRAGVTLSEAVEAQAGASTHPRVAEAFGRIAQELRRGESFHDALARVRLPLPDYMLQLARAGELTGRVGDALADGVAQMEYEHSLRTEMRNALIYPAVLVVAGVLAVALMFVFVVPKFSSLLDKADQLPFLAWAVLAGGTFANAHWPWLLLVLAVAGFAGWRASASPVLRTRSLERLARVPVVGPWLEDSETARWAKMMATLLVNRVPLIQAIELSSHGSALPERARRLGQVVRAVRGGQSLADALEDQDALSSTGYNLVRAGERSGELPEMLRSLSRLYEDAGRTRMKRVLILIEPLAILLIGGVIGTIILGVILAITSAKDRAI